MTFDLDICELLYTRSRRGLKENIIIGHLIPAGTGSPNYRNSFKTYLTTKKELKEINESLIKLY